MEMRYYRKILRISYKDHVTNEEVRAKIQQASGPHKDLLTIVKRRKLQWNGHVSRSSGLATTILQGTVKGGRGQGRQRKRWEDNMGEWTGLEFASAGWTALEWTSLPMPELLTSVSCRKDWKRISAESPLMFPRRSNRSRD